MMRAQAVTYTFTTHLPMVGCANMRGESEWVPISVTISDFFDFRAEGAFRLKKIAYSVSKKVGPTGYIDIYMKGSPKKRS